MSQLPFQIGDIVALNSHPFFEEVEFISLEGDINLVGPLMSITEVVREEIKIKAASPDGKKYKFRCKCIWFVSKVQKFEEKWICSSRIKLIKKFQNLNNIVDLPEGTIVSLNTLEFEAKKTKFQTSNLIDIQLATPYFQKDILKHSVSNFSFHVPPIMEVCGEVNNTATEPIKCPKTGNIIRQRAKKFEKCVYFNHSLGKFSEHVFPVQVLSIFLDLKDSVQIIETAISENKYLAVKQTISKVILVKPHCVAYQNGFYNLIGVDIVLNSVTRIPIPQLDNIKVIENPSEIKFPEFDLQYTLTGVPVLEVTANIKGVIADALEQDKWLKIHYSDNNNHKTIRTLIDFALHSAKVLVEGNEKDVEYLFGFCMLRSQNRIFRLGGIEQIEFINKPNEYFLLTSNPVNTNSTLREKIGE